MSDFITRDDYKPAVHAEILDAVIRQDEAALEMAEDRAVEEMASYLSSRYDTVNIFNKTGSARNNLVLMFAIDCTLYHLYSAINRLKTPVERVERYNRAAQWLKDCADGLVNPVGLPLVINPDTGADVNAAVQWGSEDRYSSHW